MIGHHTVVLSTNKKQQHIYKIQLTSSFLCLLLSIHQQQQLLFYLNHGQHDQHDILCDPQLESLEDQKHAANTANAEVR